MSAKNHDACPDFEALSLAFSEPSSAPEVATHAEGCAACAAVLADLARMKEAAKALPWSAPSANEVETLEAKLLEQAIFESQRDRRSARQRRVLVGAGAIAASIAAAFLGARTMMPTRAVSAPEAPIATVNAPAVTGTPRTDAPRALVRGSSDATFERRVVTASGRTDEVVELASGTMTFDVPELAADRGFVLVAGDVEIDARDASLTAVAGEGKLVSIAVLSGKVEVRPRDGAPVTLSAGQKWSPAVRASGAASSGPLGGLQASLQATEAARVAPGGLAEPSRPAKVVAPREPAREDAEASKREEAKRREAKREEVKREEATRAEEAKREETKRAEEAKREDAKRAEESQNDEAPKRADASQSTDASSEPVALGTPEIPARPRTVGTAATPAERAFAEGWERLRSGDVRGATARFDEAELLANGSSIAEDASYWRAVALARAKRTDDAIRAMTVYLERHGKSARAGELRVALGWLLYERGALEAADGRFAEALDDAAPRVRESAERGKKAIEAARAE